MSEQSLARMFWNRVEKSAGAPAQKFKERGTWKTLTWREVGDVVREVAAGLVALGRRPADADLAGLRHLGPGGVPPADRHLGNLATFVSISTSNQDSLILQALNCI